MKEKNRHQIFQQYGYAFALINFVEQLLELILRNKGKLNKVNLKLGNKLLQNTTLEKKRNLAKDLINDKKLDKKLQLLIGRRKRLAHTPLIQAENTKEWFFVGGNKGVEKLEYDFFDETIELANNIIQKLITLV